MSSVSLIATTSLPTPAGTLSVLVGPDGVVRAAGFAPVATIVARLRAVAGAHRDTEAWSLRDVPARDADRDDVLADVVEAVRGYLSGDLHALDTVPVVQPGGPFFQEAWTAMRSVAPGRTVTYAELAAAAGRPAAVRAAGSACARNLVAPFVPCHRVVRAGGALGGYYYGLEVKRALLALEQRG
jgi:methylated-DNA-[protein]-cysteine S-methyltransferase